MLALSSRRSKNASWFLLKQVRWINVRRVSGRLASERDSGQPRPAQVSYEGKRNEWRKPSSAAAKTPLSRDSAKSAPSLVEQLFPKEEALRRKAATSEQDGDSPRVPLNHQAYRPFRVGPTGQSFEEEIQRSQRPLRVQEEMKSQGAETSVLILRNASKNLTEEDFRRLIPQGQHMEGWKLEQGDILKIIPGRDIDTLAFAGYYYLLFSSALSALTYQGHVNQLFRIVKSQTPRSFASPIPPAPGSMIGGIDAFAAMQSYALGSPTQELVLNHLKPPLTPVVQATLERRGYPWLVDRPDKMPHEARLTLEGPQLSATAIRHAIFASGQARKFNWTRGKETAPIVTQWDPATLHIHRSLLGGTDEARKSLAGHSLSSNDGQNKERSNGQYEGWDPQGSPTRDDTDYSLSENPQREWKPREPPPVFIVGFQQRKALESFVQHWHRRPIDDDDSWSKVSPDLKFPTIANVEVLW